MWRPKPRPAARCSRQAAGCSGCRAGSRWSHPRRFAGNPLPRRGSWRGIVDRRSGGGHQSLEDGCGVRGAPDDVHAGAAGAVRVGRAFHQELRHHHETSVPAVEEECVVSKRRHAHQKLYLFSAPQHGAGARKNVSLQKHRRIRVIPINLNGVAPTSQGNGSPQGIESRRLGGRYGLVSQPEHTTLHGGLGQRKGARRVAAQPRVAQRLERCRTREQAERHDTQYQHESNDGGRTAPNYRQVGLTHGASLSSSHQATGSSRRRRAG